MSKKRSQQKTPVEKYGFHYEIKDESYIEEVSVTKNNELRVKICDCVYFHGKTDILCNEKVTLYFDDDGKNVDSHQRYMFDRSSWRKIKN